MSYQSHNKLSKTLSAVLILVVLGAVIALVFVINDEPREKFTEFYILNQYGEATDYPSELEVGSPAEVILGIVNREQESVYYFVEIIIDGLIVDKLGPVFLEHRGKSELLASFVADKPGEHQKVEFLLYRQGRVEADESLYLWVDVKKQR